MSAAPHNSEPHKDDEIQEALGDFGRWQLLICATMGFCRLVMGWHQLAIIFLAPPVPFWCAQDRNATCFVQSTINGRTAETLKCEQWEYEKSVFQSTIITEWDLVCSKAQFANVAQTVFMLGFLLGNLFFGYVADRVGRKWPMLVAIALHVLFGSLTSAVGSLISFLVLRFLNGLSMGGLMVTSFIICMEVVGTKWRSTMSTIYHLPFSIGHFTLPGLSFLFRNWKSFELAISIPSVLLLSSYWIVPESPRWLLANGYQNRARLVMTDAAKRNGISLEKVDKALNAWENKKIEIAKKAGFLDLFKRGTLRTKIIAMCSNWLVCGVCFFGLAQYIGQISGDIFINVAITGLISTPGVFVCMYCLEKFGRRKTLIASQSMTTCACLAIVVVLIVKTPTKEIDWAVVVLSVIGMVSEVIGFITVYLYSGELFPTVVRNAAFGLSSMSARVGSMIAPFVNAFATTAPFIPPIIFGILPIISILFCLLLPETRDIQLADTIQQNESRCCELKEKRQTLESIQL